MISGGGRIFTDSRGLRERKTEAKRAGGGLLVKSKGKGRGFHNKVKLSSLYCHQTRIRRKLPIRV